MERKIIGDPLDRQNRNNHNENYEYLFSLLVDTVNKIKEEISQETLDQVIQESRVNWLEAVNTEDDLPTDANVGDAVFVIEDNKAYRYDGEQWVFFQALDSSAVDNLRHSIESEMQEFINVFEGRFDDLKENVPKSIEVSTTTGKWWSDNVDTVSKKLNGVDRLFKSYPSQNYKETVVLLGSSSTEGNGASNIEDAWFNLIKDKFGSEYTLINRGIGSDNTVKVINRFYKDVAPLSPDYVIVQLTIGNEGIYTASDKYSVYKQFKDNLNKIINMIKQIGATPIIIGQAPTKRFTKDDYIFASQLNLEMQQAGVCVVDWMGNLGSHESPYYIEGMMKDNLHYNELGQTLIANSFTRDLFTQARSHPISNYSQLDGFINIKNPSTMTPVMYTPSNDIINFTIGFRFRYRNKTRPSGIISFNGDARLALVNTNQRIILYTDNNRIDVDSGLIKEGSWINIVVCQNNVLNRSKIYLNGDLMETINNSSISFEHLCLGGRVGSDATIEDADYKDVFIYRTYLSSGEVRSLYNKQPPKSSIELYAPLTDINIGGGAPLVSHTYNGDLLVNNGENGVLCK